MIEINLFDSSFVGQACSVVLQTPHTMRYVRNQMEWPGVTVFTNGQMFDPIVDDVRSRYKVGWITGDARCLRPNDYERVEDVASKFDAIMTHDAQLLARGAPFVRTIRGGSWVQLEDWCLPPKTKNVGMILSEKTALPGHQLRHAIAGAGLAIDLFGPQHTPIGHDKSSAYRDYRYAVVVEACQEENWFTEHLIDALAYGCVPIYWGCENIGEYFDRFGFIRFDTLGELIDDIVPLLTATFYGFKMKRNAANQQLALNYAITEDWQIANCLCPFVESL
jgi:hypothetical protein